MKCILVAVTILLALAAGSRADYPAKGYGKPAHVQCGSNLLVSCHPHVAHVPCHPAHDGYHHQAPAPAYHAPAPAYHAPAHHAPAPAYHAPAPAYHAPAPAKY